MSPRVKYRLICTGEQHLTTYNKEFNEKVKKRCIQKNLFSPAITCQNHEYEGEKGQVCPYLEVKKLG